MLTKHSVKKPYTVIVIMVIVIILGVISYTNTSVDLFPNMNLPFVVVASVSVGSAPETVEKEVTIPTEQSLSTLDGVKNITSMSMENISMIVLEFENNVNVDNIVVDIREKLNMMKGLDNVTNAVVSAQEGLGGLSNMADMMKIEPMIFKVNPSMMPIMMLSMGKKGVSTKDSASDFKKIITKLEAVEGVASVTTQGLPEDLLLMQLNTQDLLTSVLPSLANDIIFSTISQSVDLTEQFSQIITPEIIDLMITAQNLEMPAGTISENGLSYFVKVGEGIKTREELQTTPLISINLANLVNEIGSNTTIDDSFYYTPLNVVFGALFDLIGQGNKDEFISTMIENIGENVGEIPEEAKMFVDIVDTDTDNPMLKLNSAIYELLFGNAEYEGALKADLGDDYILTLRLGDITKTYQLDTSGKMLSTLNGEPTVTLTIMKQPNYSTAEVSKRLNKILKEEASIDSNFFYVTMFDQGFYINQAISSALMNMLTGGILAVAVLFLFLRKIRPTIVVGVSIGISVVFTFVLMYFSGITLNVVSMGGLALGVGMLVDNSIIVIENIYRQRKLGKDVISAALDGTKQIFGAIVSSTITTVIVFVPVFFVSGMVKDIFKDMALTISYSLLASLLFSITLVPMASTTFLKHDVEKEQKWFEKLREFYKKSLSFVLNKRWIVVVTLIVFLTGSIIGGVFMGKEFFPMQGVGLISVSAEINTDNIPEGKTLDEVMIEVADDFNAKLLLLDYVESVSVSQSTDFISSMAGMGSEGSTKINVQILMKQKTKKKEADAVDEIKKLCESENELYKLKVTSETDSTNASAMLGDAISVNVYSEDLDDLKDATIKITEIIRNSEGVAEAKNGLENLPLEYKLIIDKDKASKYGLTVAQVLLQVNKALASAESTSNIRFKGDDQSTTIKIYPSDYKIIEWVKTYDNKGNYIKVYVDGKNFYVINNSENEITYKKGMSNKTAGIGEEIVVDKKGNQFSYELVSGEKVVFDGGVALQHFYSANPSVPFNLVTYPIYNDLSSLGADISLGGLTGVESVELWKILDDSCLIFENENDTPIGIYKTEGYFTINHFNGRRMLTITGSLKDGYDVDTVTKNIEKALKGSNIISNGIAFDFQGQSAIITETFQTIYLVLALAIILIYLVMVAQFQSLKSPLIVMFTIPLALSGCIYALLIAGLNLSASAMVGVIILVGIIVNNGIVFVDYANQLVKSGMSVYDALIQTGYDRLRPILMTALTTVFGMFAMAFDSTAAGAMIRPMAISAMGGLIYATFLTLFVVPVMYDFFNNKDRRKNNRAKRREKKLAKASN